ncbi:MAG: chemotaxis protein CheC [Thermoleophilaceae bacterium]
MTPYSDLQIDALRELTNIGSGTAATSLSSMLGRAVDITVPNTLVLPLNEAVEAVGAAESEVTGVAIFVTGDLGATVLLIFTPDTGATLCRLLGVEPGSEIALSALCEIGNVLGASYIGALGSMTGLELEPSPPQAATDMLGAILTTVLLGDGEDQDQALVIDTELKVENEDSCAPSFLFIPSAGGVGEMLSRLGLGA